MGVIGSEQIEKAEIMLQAIYGASPDDAMRQLGNLEVDRDAFDQFLQHRIGTLRNRYNRAWRAMDPAIEPAFNTLLLHFFLTGLVAGRVDARQP